MVAHRYLNYPMIIMVVILAFSACLVNAFNLSPKSFPKGSNLLNVNSGVYSPFFSSPSCVLTLGYISSSNYKDLGKLSNSIPSTFTVISKSTSYSNSHSYYSFSDSTLFVLFNNGTSSCNVDTFSTKLEVIPLQSFSTYSFTLPYGVTKTFSFISNIYVALNVKSSSRNFMILTYDSSTSSPPTTPPYLNTTLPINANSSTTVYLDGYSTTVYFYVKCNTIGGCPVSLNYKIE